MKVTGALGLPSAINPSGVRSLTVLQSISGVGVRVGSGVGVSLGMLVGSSVGVLVGDGSVACTMAGAWVTVAAAILGGGSGEVAGSGWETATAVGVTNATCVADWVGSDAATPQAGNKNRVHNIKKFTIRISNGSPPDRVS